MLGKQTMLGLVTFGLMCLALCFGVVLYEKFFDMFNLNVGVTTTCIIGKLTSGIPPQKKITESLVPKKI